MWLKISQSAVDGQQRMDETCAHTDVTSSRQLGLIGKGANVTRIMVRFEMVCHLPYMALIRWRPQLETVSGGAVQHASTVNRLRALLQYTFCFSEFIYKED